MHSSQAYATYRFTFDHVYGPDSQQDEVYEHSAKRTVLSALQVFHVLQFLHRLCVAKDLYSQLVCLIL